MNFSKFFLPASVVALALAAVAWPVPSTGAAADDPAFVAALQDLQTQQLTIAANQVKIDAQLATIVEDLRVARLYVARAGGKKKAP